MGYWTDWAKEIAKEAQQRCAEVSKRAVQEVGEEADKHAWKLLLPVAEEGTSEAYDDAVLAWYGAYSPQYYRRSYSMVGRINVYRVGENGIGWDIPESMMKPNWGKGSTNIFPLSFLGGAHGKAVYGRPPVVTTSPNAFFEQNIDELQAVLQSQVQELGEPYFNEHFYARFEQLFNM